MKNEQQPERTIPLSELLGRGASAKVRACGEYLAVIDGLRTFTCRHCGHRWAPRKPGVPVACPKCRRRKPVSETIQEPFPLSEVRASIRETCTRPGEAARRVVEPLQSYGPAAERYAKEAELGRRVVEILRGERPGDGQEDVGVIAAVLIAQIGDAVRTLGLLGEAVKP